jgi:hypothetical protein
MVTAKEACRNGFISCSILVMFFVDAFFTLKMTGSVLSLPDGLVGLLVGCKFLGYNDWVWLTSGFFT